MADPLARSPLAAWAGRLTELSVHTGGSLAVRELPLLTQLNLRTRTVSPALPAVNRTAPWGQASLLGLGPDEWLAVAEQSVAADQLGAWDSIVDVSAARTTLVLSGPAVRGVLAHGCALDLDPGLFLVGHCAQTMLAHAQVIIWRTDEDEFRILVRPSYARHLATWITDAATELGSATQRGGGAGPTISTDPR